MTSRLLADYAEITSAARNRRRVTGFLLLTSVVFVYLFAYPPCLASSAKGAAALRKADDSFARGRYEEAVAFYRRAVEQDRSLWEAYYRMGQSYERLGKYGHALAAWLEGLDYNPGQPVLEDAVREQKQHRGSPRHRGGKSRAARTRAGRQTGLAWSYGAALGYASLSIASEREDARSSRLRQLASGS